MAALLLSLIVVLSACGVVMVTGESPAGSFVFTVDGYTVRGILTQGEILHGGRVRMLMTIDQTISTQYGSVQLTGTGIWVGETDFHSVNGQVTDVVGTLQACVIFYCQNGNFSGNGVWTGSMGWNSATGLQGSGPFRGVLTLSGLNQTETVGVAGNWTDSFQV